MFNTVVLYQHGGYWNNLNRIANSPVLAVHVEHIKLADIQFIAQIDGFEHWEQKTCRRRGQYGEFTEHPPAGGPLAQYDLSAEAGWERYQRWRDAERVMRNHELARTAPQVALDRLINLKTIETVGLAALQTIKRKPWMRSHGLWKKYPETRRYFETSLRDVDPMMRFCAIRSPYIPSGHLQTMMIALRNSRKPLKRLVLHKSSGTLRH